MKQIKMINFSILSILILIIIGVAVSVTIGVDENNEVQYMINEFKMRGHYEYQIGNKFIYSVNKEYEYENINYDAFRLIDEKEVIGNIGDVVLTTRNAMRGTIVSDITYFYSKYYFSGHCAIISDRTASNQIESEGKIEKKVYERENDWAELTNCDSIIVLTVNTTEEIKESAVEVCRTKIGMKYNYLYFLKLKNKYYCTDLISRSYDEVGIKLNYDNFISNGNDFFKSKQTYISFYQEIVEIDGEKCYYIYYLKGNDGDTNE